VADASFIAPSANLIGAVQVGSGASVWYSSMCKGAVDIGEMSSVGDRSIIVDSVVGKCVSIGAGSILQSVTVGDESTVGLGCKMLAGSSLGSQSVLAAGSVLPAGTAVPSGEMWAGSPAKKVGVVDPEEVAGIVRTAEITAELAKVHMDEAWKNLSLVEQEHDDYKRQMDRTPDVISSMREDPKWVPLPTLGEFLTKVGIHSNLYTLK
jgi:carbonic anhydrase/acetyltransferase-like protein (isoleucine patch superfamily)